MHEIMRGGDSVGRNSPMALEPKKSIASTTSENENRDEF